MTVQSKFEGLRAIYQLYFPKPSGNLEPIDPTHRDVASYVAITSVGLGVGYAWIRRPISSTIAIGTGVIGGVPMALSSALMSLKPKDKQRDLEEEGGQKADSIMANLRCWLVRTASHAIDPNIGQETKIAWVATVVPVVGLVAYFSPDRLFWYTAISGTSALTDAALIQLVKQGYTWETQENQKCK